MEVGNEVSNASFRYRSIKKFFITERKSEEEQNEEEPDSSYAS